MKPSASESTDRNRNAQTLLIQLYSIGLSNKAGRLKLINSLVKINLRVLAHSIMILLLVSCGGNNTPSTEDNDELLTFAQKLQLLEGIKITEIASPNAQFSQSYIIDITQPIDHNAPTAGNYEQRIYLHYVDEASPVIFNTRGYTGSENIHEVTTLTKANQITVTARYYEHAIPHKSDWQYLTIEQQSDDLHAIFELFKPLLNGKWLSTGTSKGGMNALFYRYAYPNDMDVTIAYAAPIMFGREDLRFDTFVYETVSNKGCRDKISDFQRLVLSNKEAVLSVLALNPDDFNFSLLRALEYSVLEYPFAFWQYAPSDCASIPMSTSTTEQLATHLNQQSNLRYFSRDAYTFFSPGFIQGYNEVGYYRYKTEHLADLLEVTDYSPHDFVPESGKRNFEPNKMRDISSWLINEGQQIIYIYGGFDPYTAAAVKPSDTLDSFSIIQPSGSHSVRINMLDEKDRVYSAIESWLNVKLVP